MTARKVLNPEQEAALLAFKAKHGRFWKRILMRAWYDGTDNDPYLRQVRNQYGIAWLQRY